MNERTFGTCNPHAAHLSRAQTIGISALRGRAHRVAGARPAPIGSRAHPVDKWEPLHRGRLPAPNRMNYLRSGAGLGARAQVHAAGGWPRGAFLATLGPEWQIGAN